MFSPPPVSIVKGYWMALTSEQESTIRLWVEENWESYTDDADDLDDAKENMVADFQSECDLEHLGAHDLDEAVNLVEDVFYEQ